jgi:hypothetical protein
MDLFEKILLALGCLAAVCAVYAVAYGTGRLSGEDSHPFPVVIPHDRITGTRGEKIGPDAAIYCTRDLKNCTHVGLPGAVHEYHFARCNLLELCVQVEFVPKSEWDLGWWIIVPCLFYASPIIVFCMAIIHERAGKAKSRRPLDEAQSCAEKTA